MSKHARNTPIYLIRSLAFKIRRDQTVTGGHGAELPPNHTNPVRTPGTHKFRTQKAGIPHCPSAHIELPPPVSQL
ncbi:hypothetical protein CONLIGDRAFT_629632 [Coniochaeta ligniaria NRRL 30616]|uniref:Uncharacterized protein n=1 Tax=Coniochaeta ligniaria NRRL 30616 TaxID=1408157 RepID=A0A1J7JW04_9PEZI|nr:hypothetical protein CONLIGDRAFT_629632 [Coniochaeta ligniaria NRRL 30616]